MSLRKLLKSSRFTFRELPLNRMTLVMGLGFAFAFVLFAQLFYLQVLRADYYSKIAFEKNQGYTEIPARRGNILIQDRNSGEPYALATNTTFKFIYADPVLLENPTYVGEKLAPLLFDLESEQQRDQERFETLQDEHPELFNTEPPTEETTPVETTSTGSPTESTTDTTSTETPVEINPTEPTLSYDDLRLHTDEELFSLFQQELINALSQKTRSVILIVEKLDPEDAAAISNLKISGIEVTEDGDLYAYPSLISNKGSTAKKLAEILDADHDQLETILKGQNRYVILKRKLPYETSEQIEAIMEAEPKVFAGIKLREEYYRYYPEGTMGAQVLGYVNGLGEGQYGIEESFDEELRGKDGYFSSQLDASGNPITVGDSEIQDAVNGSDIVLTIDRAIQVKAEEVIQFGVETYRADSGFVIVMEPSTGKILAMAHYPTFDPNNYGEVYDLEKIELTQDQIDNLYRVGEDENERIYLYIRKDPDERIELFYDPDTDQYYKYKNDFGPEVYQLKAVTLPYEPGSVYKPIAMSAAIDAGEVTPYTTFNSSGPVQVDEYQIHTFNDQYFGISTMTEVLIHSDNTGMVFVAFKLGAALFYDYIKAFGFGEKTDIEFDNEHTGQLEYYEDWADSEMVTKAFGQGLTVTGIQLISAFSAIANHGILMQPYIVDYIEYGDGTRQEFEPKTVRRVINEETAAQITSMMTAVIENAVPLGKLDNNYMAGKTGTAQTYKWGVALNGVGTTVVTFVGFAPIDDPQFVVLIKLDRPKTSEWCTATAGPTFKPLGDFLVSYYNLPPDKNE